MKILNETVYCSDDIRELVIATRDLCAQELKEQRLDSERRYKAGHYGSFNSAAEWWTPSPLPEMIRIGYYKPTNEAKDSVCIEYGTNEPMSSVTSRYGTAPRIGIVPVERLGLPEMLVVAHAASDSKLKTPLGLRQDVARSISKIFRGSPPTSDLIALARRMPLGITHEVKCDPASLKVEKIKARQASLLKKIDIATDNITRAREKLLVLEARRQELRDRLVKLNHKKEKALSE